jgi:hypothetical protein
MLRRRTIYAAATFVCSESGKLITQLFARIGQMLDDPDTFLCVLIGTLGCDAVRD